MVFVYYMPRNLRLVIAILAAPPFIILGAAAKYGFEGVVSTVFVCAILLAIVLAVCRQWNHAAFLGSIVVAALLACYIYIPHWLLLSQATTPRDHVLVAEDFLTPGKLYGDERKAWEHYRIAAEGGDAEAQFEVAGGYLYGWYGVTQDRDKARQWMKASADQGYPSAIKDLKDIDTAKF